MKLLIIEDSHLIRDRIISRLKNNTITEILEAPDAKIGYELLESHLPEIIILDLHLPDDSGINILTWIKKNKVKSFIIVLTNHSELEYELTCMELGADYFLSKTKDFDRLFEIINKYTSNKRAS